MKLLIIISMFLQLIFCDAFAQTIRFKGQLLQDTKVIKNYTLLVDGNPATTDDAGIFEAVLNGNATQVKIQPSDQRYVILYPQGGRLLVPKDVSLVTEVFVTNFKSNEYLKEYLSVSKQLKDSIGKSQSYIQSLRAQLDSVISVLYRLSYTETDLRSAKEIQEGKDRNLFDITKDLDDYARNAQNLVSAFKYVSDYAFTDPKALLQLSEAISNYNQVYDRLDGKHIFYQKMIADYWGEEEANSFNAIADLAINKIHLQKIYPLRELLKQIRDYFNNNNKDKQLKLNIQQKISEIVPEIEQATDDLKTKTKQFSQSL